MVAKAENKTDEEKEVTPLNPSDLDPDELAKAIEESVAGEVKPSSTDKKPAKTDEAAPKSADKKSDKKPAAKPADEDKGVPIIVKRRSGYVAPPSVGATAEPAKTEAKAEEKPLEPPSKTQKTVDPEPNDDKPAGKPQPETEESAEQPVQAAKPQEDNPQAQPARPSEPAAEPAPAPAASRPAEEPQPQKPTVFDTTEYHLPIKSRSRHYVNGAVAWIVLLLVLAGAAGYVLYRLGIIEFGDLNAIG